MKLWVATVGVCLGWVLFIGTHWFFTAIDFYWYTWWADVVMHTAGGVLIVSTWYVIFYQQVFPRALRWPIFHPLLILAAMVLVWEIFEYLNGLTTTVNYAFDTFCDLTLGFGGGLVVFLLCRSRTIK